MRIYRTVIHGHVIEARQGDLGCDRVLLNGRIISTKRLGGWYNASHFFDIVDEDGGTRHVEVGWIDRSKLGLGKYRARILVDGVERCELEPIDQKHPVAACMNCGYPLKGLPVENAEIRCPECGRHTPAAIVFVEGGEVSQTGNPADDSA